MTVSGQPSNRTLVAEIRQRLADLPTATLYRLASALEATLAKNRLTQADYRRLKAAATPRKGDQ